MRLYSCKHPMDEETPGPCSWCEGNLLGELARERQARECLEKALDRIVRVGYTGAEYVAREALAEAQTILKGYG